MHLQADPVISWNLLEGVSTHKYRMVELRSLRAELRPVKCMQAEEVNTLY